VTLHVFFIGTCFHAAFFNGHGLISLCGFILLSSGSFASKFLEIIKMQF